ncbi:Rossmann-like domain-containing protein [Halanaerobaculum tunisiense]
MINKIKDKLADLVAENDLREEEIKITARPLSTKEAIGETSREDFPLQTGEEVLIQAEFKGCLGQAFTDSPKNFKGRLADILDLNLSDNFNRALLVATLNAITKYLGIAEDTIHCKDDEPEDCGAEIATQVVAEYGTDINVGIIGFQPAIIENIVGEFKPAQIRVTDLNPDNINTTLAGVKIWDGTERTEELIKASDLVLATGSTVVNDSLEEIIELTEKYNTELILFGTTIAGTAAGLGLDRLCPYSC